MNAADTPLVIPLWPEGVPAAVRPDVPAAKGPLGPETAGEDGRLGNISAPTLTVHRPAVDRSNGTAVIVCPGGGYRILSAEREGVQYANWLEHARRHHLRAQEPPRRIRPPGAAAGCATRPCASSAPAPPSSKSIRPASA
ncbi:MAG: hypothetical protein WDM96_18335 [Lacunisphaera sp.]